ncbi:MAG: glycosyl hydrolase, partial [Acidobacteriota bacterium]|nr:glycosyl hydrolase [Acidobacteriota bacterium]
MSHKPLAAAVLAGLFISALTTGCGSKPAADLSRSFATPPPSARPWVYWFWSNGNITREGITADLEAMKRAGIGGVLIMEVDQSAPQGPVAFGGPEWRKLFAFVCSEAERLGLEVNMNNDAGWCGSGGPWVTPELAAQKVVWSETAVRGPKRFEGALPAPETIAGYYRDIRVLAFPAPPAGAAGIDGLRYKTAELATEFHYNGRSSTLPTRAAWPEPAAGETIARDRIVDLTGLMDAAGKIAWDVPAGEWTILRFGHTPTGKENAPAPASGRGLDCDKMSLEAIKAHFDGFLGPLADAVGERTGKTFVSVHIDSWETNTQNWTKDFAQEFRRRRGYDPLPFLPVLSGRLVDGRGVSERFLWDFRQTISELVLDRYAGGLQKLAAGRGLRLSIEAYTTCPTDELAYGGRADEPMGEFWPIWFGSGQPYGFGFTCTEMTSAGHIYGKRIIGAESFTSTDEERWLLHPAKIKEIGDWAFAEGINRFVFHRYAMQPWPNVKPGLAMGPWGLHYERTQSWWNLSTAWHEYLARCQYLLRQGLFTADVCYLTPEGSPQSIGIQKRFFARNSDNRDEARDRTGYNFDLCPPEALLTRMSVKDGRLVLPDGMSYRLLVLPQVETMTPALLRK